MGQHPSQKRMFLHIGQVACMKDMLIRQHAPSLAGLWRAGNGQSGRRSLSESARVCPQPAHLPAIGAAKGKDATQSTLSRHPMAAYKVFTRWLILKSRISP
jgi:hypothetical protein